jgi:hypothetical protein
MPCKRDRKTRGKTEENDPMKFYSSLTHLPKISRGKQGWTNRPVLAKVMQSDGSIDLIICEFDRIDADRWIWQAWVPEKTAREWTFVEICPPSEWAYLPENWWTIRRATEEESLTASHSPVDNPS